ncbi:winged helix-turn-helix domain-containing protein [Plastoroseomonas hellenica]|uniref:winged helix-turn-helix domain-containing protein n=1 Tax=Plastoroseomonas hellenica TaxID=2687306 RepID=UPI001BA92EC7|nr:winged helix-turn-helix domain-containing protein [Plastoroseomonas hellenica]MBR0642728.1 transcriptional regulator [Plastoroseomonas hellenica]
MPSAESYAIGRWSFHPSESVVRSADEERRLENRAARTLAVLCEHRGQLVGKEELIAAVWQGRSVSPNSVAVVIGDLRRAIEDDPGSPLHIVTVNKRGYRLNTASSPVPIDIRRSRRSMLWKSVAVPTLLAGLIGIACTDFQARSQPVDLVVTPVVNETNRGDLEPLSRSLDAVVIDSALRLRNVRVLSGQIRVEAPNSSAWIMRSRLIIWNGAPELAISVVEGGSRRVIWSGFAGGPPESLAKSVADRVATLEARITT